LIFFSIFLENNVDMFRSRFVQSSNENGLQNRQLRQRTEQELKFFRR
jgi:hypothetical protein